MKTNILTAEYVAKNTDGTVLKSGGFAHGVSIDTRTIKQGNIFAAINGENVDGHNFISSALAKGAAGILCEKDISVENGFAVKTENTVAALGRLASAYRSEFRCPMVGVTGSVGKTTTRVFVQSVLSTAFKTYGTEGNFNNEIGLPVSILNMGEDAEAGVFELGMGVKGDIEKLSKILSPTVGVITNIGTAHIEFLGSREAIRDAKLEIRQGLRENGTLILNGDEPLLSEIDGAVYCSMKNADADYFSENVCFKEDGMTFDILKKGDRVTENVFVPAFGEHIVMDALYAFAVGDILGIPYEKIIVGIASYSGVGMRQNIVEKDGKTFILDYYNASPEAIKASFNVTDHIAERRNGRTVCVLGSVLELGAMSEELHRGIGEYIAAKCDLLVTFGEDASFIADQAEKFGMNGDRIAVFRDIEDPEAAVEYLKKNLIENDVVLFKASHGIRLGRIAEKFID